MSAKEGKGKTGIERLERVEEGGPKKGGGDLGGKLVPEKTPKKNRL